MSETWNREELYAEIWEKPLVKVGAKYNISAVALGKVCRKLQIPLPKFEQDASNLKMPPPRVRIELDIFNREDFIWAGAVFDSLGLLLCIIGAVMFSVPLIKAHCWLVPIFLWSRSVTDYSSNGLASTAFFWTYLKRLASFGLLERRSRGRGDLGISHYGVRKIAASLVAFAKGLAPRLGLSDKLTNPELGA